MTSPPKCLRCGAQMEEGFILDSAHGGVRRVATWVAGRPERSAWTGSAKVRGKKQHPIQSYRCTKCGYLESYARDESS